MFLEIKEGYNGRKNNIVIATKNDDKWPRNFECLKAYGDERHHLPPKNAPLGAKYLLNWIKYVRKTIKEGTCNKWKRDMFENLMSGGSTEHTGGRKRKEL